MKRPHVLLLFLFVLLPWASLAQLAVPDLANRRVHDDAHILSSVTVSGLEQTLKQFEDSTSNQIAILTVPSLEGEVIEQFGIRVAEAWKLGQKEKDNGIILLVAVNDRKMRIEVGQGLEGPLPDALCSRIIRNEMAPRFRKGDYDGGVIAAVEAIKAAIKGEYKGEDTDIGRRRDGKGGGAMIGLVILFLLGTFTYTALFTKGCAGWGLYGFLTPFYAIFPGIALGSTASGWTIFFVYLIGFPILKLILGKTAWGQQVASNMEESARRNRNRGGGWSSGGGWFMGGGGGSSWGGGGGGGFSGGGGSFGGGGSSGSW